MRAYGKTELLKTLELVQHKGLLHLVIADHLHSLEKYQDAKTELEAAEKLIGKEACEIKELLNQIQAKFDMIIASKKLEIFDNSKVQQLLMEVGVMGSKHITTIPSGTLDSCDDTFLEQSRMGISPLTNRDPKGIPGQKNAKIKPELDFALINGYCLLCENLKDHKQKVLLYYILAANFMSAGNYSRAEFACRKALIYLEHVGAKVGEQIVLRLQSQYANCNRLLKNEQKRMEDIVALRQEVERLKEASYKRELELLATMERQIERFKDEHTERRAKSPQLESQLDEQPAVLGERKIANLQRKIDDLEKTNETLKIKLAELESLTQEKPNVEIGFVIPDAPQLPPPEFMEVKKINMGDLVKKHRKGAQGESGNGPPQAKKKVNNGFAAGLLEELKKCQANKKDVVIPTYNPKPPPTQEAPWTLEKGRPRSNSVMKLGGGNAVVQFSRKWNEAKKGAVSAIATLDFDQILKPYEANPAGKGGGTNSGNTLKGTKELSARRGEDKATPEAVNKSDAKGSKVSINNDNNAVQDPQSSSEGDSSLPQMPSSDSPRTPERQMRVDETGSPSTELPTTNAGTPVKKDSGAYELE